MKPRTRTTLALTPLEDRTVPTVLTISVSSNTLVEASGPPAPVTVTVTRDNTSGSLGYNFSRTGTGTAGSDYSAPPGTGLFANGQATSTFFVWALDDSTSEATETAILTLTAGSGYTVGTPDSVTLNILDNDAQVVTVAKANDAVENDGVENNTDGVFRFTRIGNLSSSLTVNYTVGGTASSGTDFTAIGTTVTFAANSATADKAVNALHDGVVDDSETVTVTIGTGSGYSAGSPNSASLDVIDTDFDPSAFDAPYTTATETPLEVSVIDLASDLDGDTLTVTGITQGAHGTVVDNLDGTVTYTADTGYSGDDSFTYTVEDPFGNDSTGTITVTVTAPLAPPTSLWTAVNTAVTVDALAMTFDPDEDTLSVTAITQGSHGTVVDNLDGTLTYTPTTSYSGEDSFTYTVEDPSGNEATNTIHVTVGTTDPIALDDSVATAVNTGVTVAVLDLAYQPAGGSITTTSVTQGTHGSVTINGCGTVTYTPNTSYSGTDTFTYTITDAASNTATGTITVTVGTPAPTDADAILDAFDDILDSLESYDSSTATTITGLIDGISSTLADYMADSAALLVSLDIRSQRSNLPFRTYIEEVVARYSQIKRTNDLLNDFYDELDAMLVKNKQAIESVMAFIEVAKLAPMPNSGQIAALNLVLKQLGEFHLYTIDQIGNVSLTEVKSLAQLQMAYKSVRETLGPGMTALFLGAAPSNRILPRGETFGRYVPFLP